MTEAIVTLASPALAVDVATCGAELQRIVDGSGRDYLWSGDPRWWIGRAPLLFPIVGALAGGVLRVDGVEHHLPKHGFARVSEFEIVARDASSAIFRLRASDETRRQYPFDFTLDMRFAVTGATLAIAATLANPGAAPLPASFGFHPALRWPLPGGGARGDHVVRFAQAEPAPIRRIDGDGLLTPAEHRTPIEADLLRPHDALFVDDALILPALASRSIVYGAPGHAGVRITHDLPSLGIWTKPGAPFLCIEPWQGHADPEDFTGEFRDKPGVIEVAPGAARTFSMRLAFGIEVPI